MESKGKFSTPQKHQRIHKNLFTIINRLLPFYLLFK